MDDRCHPCESPASRNSSKGASPGRYNAKITAVSERHGEQYIAEISKDELSLNVLLARQLLASVGLLVLLLFHTTLDRRAYTVCYFTTAH